MLQSGGELDLALETLSAERGRDRGQEHFERDKALVLDIVGEIHRRHAASAELALDEVALGQGVAQTGWDLGQWRVQADLGAVRLPCKIFLHLQPAHTLTDLRAVLGVRFHAPTPIENGEGCTLHLSPFTFHLSPSPLAPGPQC